MFAKIALFIAGLGATVFAQESIESQNFEIESADADVEAMDAEIEGARFGGGSRFGGGPRFHASLFRDYPGFQWFPYPHPTYPLQTLPNIPFGRTLPPTYFGDSYPRTNSYRFPQSVRSIRQY